MENLGPLVLQRGDPALFEVDPHAEIPAYHGGNLVTANQFDGGNPRGLGRGRGGWRRGRRRHPELFPGHLMAGLGPSSISLQAEHDVEPVFRARLGWKRFPRDLDRAALVRPEVQVG